jgi:hypothetical protein
MVLQDFLNFVHIKKRYWKAYLELLLISYRKPFQFCS